VRTFRNSSRSPADSLRLATLVFAVGLAGCGGSDSHVPAPDPVSQAVVLSANAPLLYVDESMDVRVRFVRQLGGPASLLPVTITGRGEWTGPRETDAAGEVRGTWRPGGDGSASLSLALEGRTATVETRVVSRQVTDLEVTGPSGVRAGAPFELLVQLRDGKGQPPTEGALGELVFVLGDSSTTLPALSGGTTFEGVLTRAGATLFRVEHDAGPRHDGSILVTSGSPAELAFEASIVDGAAPAPHASDPYGREDDEAVILPTFVALDSFGNPLEGSFGVEVGGGGTFEPTSLVFTGSGRATPERWRFGTGGQAGWIRVFDDGGGAEALVPVLPRRTVLQVVPTGLPGIAFTENDVAFSFRATGDGGPVAFGRWSVLMGGELVDDGRLDTDGRSGTVELGRPPVGPVQLEVRVDGHPFPLAFEVRTPPVPATLEILSGNAQVALAGSVLQPLRVRIRDQHGDPIEAPVSWDATGGAVSGMPVSAPDGTAEATWTLPPDAGAWETRVSAGDLEAVFTATATEAPALASLEAWAGANQTGLQGAEAPSPIVVRARDQFGNPFPVQIEWSGAGSFAPPTSWTSNASGLAETTWTLPTTPGTAQAEARAGGLVATFTAQVIEAPYPASLVAVSGSGQTALGGTTLGSLLVVEARDQFGDPIAAQVGWSGPGNFSSTTVTTSASTGRASVSWTLPVSAGNHQATASVGAVDAVFEAVALAPPTPASIEIVAGDAQAGLGGKPFPVPLRVRVRDQYGDPIGGAGAGSVSWSGDGGFAPGTSSLSVSGEATTTWTPPVAAGGYQATASIGGLEADFVGTVTSPPLPWTIELVSGGGQTGEIGAALPNPVRVRVRDQDGDPFPGQVSFLGDGSFAPASTTANGAGNAETTWTLPGAAGAVQGRAATAHDTVTFAATAEDPPPAPVVHPVIIDGHYLVQTIQTEDHEMELVGGRAALFRGFLERVEPGAFEARLLIRQSGSVVQTIVLTSPSGPPSGTPDRMNQSTSFQAVVPANRITPNLSYTLEVESAAGVLSEDVTPTVIPRSPLGVTFVPVRVDSTGTVGNVTPGNVGDFLGRIESLPYPDVQATVRAEYVYGGSPVTGDGDTWSPLVNQIRQLRIADGSPNLYYGVVVRQGSSGVAGIGYVGLPASVGIWSSNASLTQYIFNHEVGHNLSLSHAPCGVEGGAAFPYPDGRIGAHGYLLGAVLAPTTPDVMGYCGGYSFGTYHWSRAINYTPPGMVSFAGAGPHLRLWGDVIGGEISLSPPYVGGADTEVGLTGPPVGLRIRSATGQTLWTGSAPLIQIDHVDGGGFSAGVPVALLGEDRDGLVIDVTFDGRTRSFAWGDVDTAMRTALDATVVPMAEVYRNPSGAVVGFGVEGRGAPPAGALVQDGTLEGRIWTVDAAGNRIGVVGRADDFLRR
jgi:hypothetical protein